MRTRRVFKYVVPIDDRDHEVPFWVIAAAPGPDERSLHVWAEVDVEDDEEPTVEPYRVFATGQPIPDGAAHHATVQAPPFVWHLYNTALCAEGGAS